MQAQPADHPRRRLDLLSGEQLYPANGAGQPWRLSEGIIRLDSQGGDGEARFASLAIAGDILGCETLLFGCYTFRATALTPCRLTPWPEGAAAVDNASLLASLAKAQQRAADLVALRGGQATSRVLGLVRLLADQAGRVVLPTRQDIADITDLRFETISRIIKLLERSQVLTPIRIDGVHATRSFQINQALAI